MIPPERAVVRHSITVNASQETAFATFTGGHDRWWPRDFHFGGAELEEAVPEGRERTRVELEHRGLDAYGDAMDQMRGQFDSGWPGILAGFAAVAGAI